MFLYVCTDDPAAAAVRGLAATPLFATLEVAQAQCAGSLLVVDAVKLPKAIADAQARIPPEALCNADPYLPPKHITACGGYVVREQDGELQILMIKRRGFWDIPKGKLDAGESISECAVREVQEEVGIEAITLHQPLGTTLHGYAHKGSYAVKTTHWFLMTTDAEHFVPQADEDITKVRYRRWGKAIEKVGFETLREHLIRVEPMVRDALRRMRDAS